MGASSHRMVYLLASLLLVSCATTTVPPKILCLPMRQYTVGQQAAVLVELQALPSSSMIRIFLSDYLSLRDANRACLGQQP